MRLFLLLLLSAVLSATVAATAALSLAVDSTTPLFADPLTAPKVRTNTTQGVVEGYSYRHVHHYRGLPYAAPPTGSNRFRVPQPPAAWSGVRKAYADGHVCPQFHLSKSLYLGKEDCLYLSLYVPEKAKTSKTPLPVLFWIHGGAWVLGDGYEFGFYDGATLAHERGAIVVTINYRLAALGFLALDELRDESEDGKSVGNLALKDQRAALLWVQQHIASFNGDPHRVTLFGESAGAFSVCFHLASQASRGLFAAAIVESGTCDSRLFFVPPQQAVAWSRTWLRSVGCDTATRAGVMACLRGKKAEELVAPPVLRRTAAAWRTAGELASGLAAPGPNDADAAIDTLAVASLTNLTAADAEIVRAVFDRKSARNAAYAAVLSAPGVEFGSIARSVAFDDAAALRAGKKLAREVEAEAEVAALAHSLALDDAAALAALLPRRAPSAAAAEEEDYYPPMYPLMSWAAVIDGSPHGLTDAPSRVMAAGRGAAVPVVMGSNKDEGTLFIPIIPLIVPGVSFPLKAGDIPVALRHVFGADFPVEAAMELYPAKQFKCSGSRFAQMLRDNIFTCTARRVALAREPFSARAGAGVGAAGNGTTHIYHFTYNSGFIETLLLGTYHAAELPFVFHNEWPWLIHAFKPADHKVAKVFGAYWGNLAATGAVNGVAGAPFAGPVAWPAFTAAAEETLVIDKASSVKAGLFKPQCEFWDAHV